MTMPAVEPVSSEASRSPPTATITALDAVLRPVRSGNAFEEAVQRILQSIKLGVVTFGERLPPERTLAKRLGISRATLREALHALTDANLVESRRGRTGGTFITYRPEDGPARMPTTPDIGRRNDLEGGLVLRAVLESGAAEAAAEREHGDAARTTLLERVEATATATTRHTHRLADARLHLTIAELSGSAGLIAAVADVQMRLTDMLEAIPVLPQTLQRSHRRHAAIAEAILAGRAEDARRHMREHLRSTATHLRGFLA